ncbi:MAG: hypothetical protein ACREUH_01625 [Burkholderiales bacterium]
MSTPDKKPSPADLLKDPNLELAREIYIGMAQRIYSAPSNPEQKKPEPKALATLCFRLAEAFEAASRETPKVKAALEAASKASVKLADVDMSSMFESSKS